MEPYINNNINDITYQSKLIPPFWFIKHKSPKRAGFNSHSNLHSLRSVSCVLI